jgi:hypothetical protein
MMYDAYDARTKEVANAAKVTPISVAELKSQLRITHAAEDAYLLILVNAATKAVETYLGRKIITATMEAWFDTPMSDDRQWWDGVKQASASHVFGGLPRALTLPWIPLITVSEVSTFGDDNTETVFASSKYIIDSVDPDLWGRLVLNLGEVWPTDLRQANSLRVQYTAGYGAAADDVPADLKMGVLQVAAWAYVNRGPCGEDACEKAGVTQFLEQYRVVRL